MCAQDQTNALLRDKGLSPTPKRAAVFQCLLQSAHPLTAPEILQQSQKSCAINKATLYRILDLLVDHGLALRHSAGERSFRYCALEPAEGGAQKLHCHFHCTRCGAMQCLEGGSLLPSCQGMATAAGAQLENVEVRLDGLCQHCRHKQEAEAG